jgi:uncharacterized protein YycO
MHRRFFFIIIIILFTSCKEEKFVLYNGDLLFQANEPSKLTEAIEGAGSGYQNFTFSHVGIVIVSKDTSVIEAVPEYGVRIVSLQTFLNDSKKDKNNKPLVCVGRLHSKYKNIIYPSIERVKLLQGKKYDSIFMPDNDAYYCSELVEKCFLNEDNTPIFKTAPMSFKDKNGNFYPAWIDFFSRIGIPIPEGVKGTNPNDMSNSKAITIIHKYF